MNFNPRTPYRVRLGVFDLPPVMDYISIHALHTECDNRQMMVTETVTQFQSTHSIQSATKRASLLVSDQCDFNPRTPYRVRQNKRLWGAL
ncbi:hypothetical protein PAEAM_44810 [Paenibacillus sp. GM1FR]|nr:hypothetical protein PAEAM_44810 [Paenibacillus sp. GM1FR]